MKVIPAIDIMNRSVIRLVKGNPSEKIIYSDNPVEIAKRWEEEGADIIHVVDIDAALNNDINNSDLIIKIIQSVNIPVQVGGGIRKIEDGKRYFKAGVFSVVIGTMAYKEPENMLQLIKKYKKIIISIDQKDGIVMINGWKNPSTYSVRDAMSNFLNLGIEQFLLTSIDRDGTLTGPDIEMLSYACSFQNAQIIASGGISNLEDIIRVKNIGCYGVILGKALYDNKIDIRKVKAII